MKSSDSGAIAMRTIGIVPNYKHLGAQHDPSSKQHREIAFRAQSCKSALFSASTFFKKQLIVSEAKVTYSRACCISKLCVYVASLSLPCRIAFLALFVLFTLYV